MYAICNGRIFTGQHWLEDHAIIIDDNCIKDICPQTTLQDHIQIEDASDLLLVPAFIDLQLNGCGGVMFNDSPTLATLRHMHNTNLTNGTHCFLPTLITDSDSKMLAAIDAMADFQALHPHFPGLHLEGPWLSCAKKGVHSQRFIRPPADDLVNSILKSSAQIAMITLAPEAAEPALISALRQAKIQVALGHSNCTFEAALTAFAAGANFTTHLFNAMSPFTGREPGLVGAALYHQENYCGIICDGQHVHPASIALAHQIKADKLILVTDATAAASATISQFQFVDHTVQVKHGLCQNADGTLGGSSLTLIDAIEYCHNHVGIELETCLKMASLYPATSLAGNTTLQGMGTISKGNRAEICGLKLTSRQDKKHADIKQRFAPLTTQTPISASVALTIHQGQLTRH